MTDRHSSDGLVADRAQTLLKFLIERYIADGQPIGSRTLAKDSGTGLSPATIRNVMSDLEEMGLIVSPHTSAGRIPTAKGYRLFIDNLLTVKPLENQLIEEMKIELATGQGTDKLLSTASSLLSNVTNLAGLVTVPKTDRARLEHIEFLPLSGRQILVILVVNGQEVQNRVIQADKDYSATQLQTVANYLNSEYAGKELSEIRHLLLSSLQQSRDALQAYMVDAINIADQVLDVQQDNDYVMAGETHLMAYDEMCDIGRLRNLFEAFNEKQEVLQILDQSLAADGTQVFIGEESGYEVFDECSLVTAPYTVDDQVIGALGVIGPTRMAYDRIIPIVDVTAKVLSNILSPE